MKPGALIGSLVAGAGTWLMLLAAVSTSLLLLGCAFALFFAGCAIVGMSA